MQSNKLLPILLSVLLALSVAMPVMAATYMIGGEPLTIHGFIAQSVQFSTEDDAWNNQKDFNGALMDAFLEGDYTPHSDWTIYASGRLRTDWAYDILSGDDDWDRKQFSESREELYFEDEWWQLLREAHVTWKPGNFWTRIGKQQVRWGEMEVFPVNDLINPFDVSRGFMEIDVEQLALATPLAMMQYDSDLSAGAFSDISVQFVFNPNAKFIANQGTFFGNDAAGVWAADVAFPELGLRLGRIDQDIDDPDAWDSDNFEYGVKLSSMIDYTTTFSLMGFYGRANSPATNWDGMTFSDDSFTIVDDDGLLIGNPVYTGKYPRQKFVGFALSTQVPARISFLGGFEPVVRVEGSYQFDNQYMDANYATQDSDQIVFGVGFDYKIRVPWQKGFIGFQGEAQYNKITDYEDSWQLPTEDQYWQLYMAVWSTYIRGKLMPALEWYAENDARAQIWSPSVSYTFSDRWDAKLKYSHFTGHSQKEYWGYQDKDNVALKVTYQF